VYFKGFLEDRPLSVFDSLVSKVPLLSRVNFLLKTDIINYLGILVVTLVSLF